MATGALPTLTNNSSPLGVITDLSSLIGMYTGGGKKTSTSTTSSNISNEGVTALVNGILGSTQGLADTTSGANRAGLYNSSTTQQLTDDLIARTAAETESRRVGTTTTGMVQDQGMGLGSLAGTLALAQGAPMITNALSTGGSSILNALGLGGGAAIGAGAGGALATGLGFGASGAALGAAPALGFGAAGSALGAGGAAAGLGGGLGAALGAEGAAAAGLGGLGGAAGLGALGPIGIGAGLLMASGILGDISVVCTALAGHGIVSKELLSKGQEYVNKMSPVIKAGYYFWGRVLAKRVSVSASDSALVRVVASIALPYLQYRAGEKNLLGAAIAKIGEPLCFAIGSIVLFTKQTPETAA